ncbi:MAG: Tryptophan--tRNA ligase [Owenweeksia sp. TMED14]|nr:MAG: Tryptophan--tRNA ligase [Owenweeksia sp. TMED14]|tara:strand:+ start:11264 stop:12238 length:975 start_codon:yes stop_codon:yes gene_type:complete
MARILTGIQSSGRQHLGNVLGAIKPAIKLANDDKNDAFLFIADLHSLTSIKDKFLRKENLLSTAAAWLACGLDPEKVVFYAQSDLPQCTELTWYLNCFTPYPMLANAHSFKDKANRLSDINAGLFDYPVLMASDILLYNANLVPVGKDQRQHLEMTRDIAEAFNRHVQKDILVIPEAKIDESVMTIPGTDGQKMSKSYGNVIDVFLPEKDLKKQVMSIVTDSIPLEDSKNPDLCNVVKIFKLIAPADEIAQMEKSYRTGGYGYGHAKAALFRVLLETFRSERLRFEELMQTPDEIYRALNMGAEKARYIADETLMKVKQSLGFR